LILIDVLEGIEMEEINETGNEISKVQVSENIEKIIIDELGAVPLDKLENISSKLVNMFFNGNNKIDVPQNK